MPRKTRYSVQVEFSRKGKDPFCKAGMTRNQYGVEMKRLWKDYILKLDEKSQNERGDYFLKFTARKRKRSDMDGSELLRNWEREAGEDDQGSGIRDYQQGW